MGISSDNWKKEFAGRLRRTIKRTTDGNVSEFAKDMTMSDRTVNKYLKGSMPGADKLLEIAKRGGVSTDWLLTGKESTEPESDDKTRQAIADIKEIMASGNKSIALALEMNLAAFKLAILTEKENDGLKGDVAQLKKEMRHFKRMDSPKRKPISGEVNGAGT